MNKDLRPPAGGYDLRFMNNNELTIKEARELLDSGKITAKQLVLACLAQIKKKDGEIKACLQIDEEKALAQASLADERLKAGERGPVLGIPYLAKDNILVKDLKATAASKMLENYTAPFSATVVARLETAGAICLGKTNLDEFAHGASTENSYFGATHNPWNLACAPGGSSGGSAAAIASNMALFALGTDTGGSVRHPAAFCGTVGFKPTYGLCSRHGLISMTSSTDVPGVLAKTAEDASLVMSVIAGADVLDSTTLAIETNFENNLENLAGLRIGLVKEFMSDAVAEGVMEKMREAIEKAMELGAEIAEASLPYAPFGVSVYYIITPSEVSSNLARFDGLRYGFKKEATDNLAESYLANRGQGFGSEAKRRIMLGTYVLSAGYHDKYYLKAQKVRTLIAEDFDKAFASFDYLLCPTTPSTAFKLGEQAGDPLKMYLEDIFLTPASLAGLPAVSIPAGLSNYMPVGLQLIGQKGDDGKLLAVAEVLLKSLGGRLNLK